MGISAVYCQTSEDQSAIMGSHSVHCNSSSAAFLPPDHDELRRQYDSVRGTAQLPEGGAVNVGESNWR